MGREVCQYVERAQLKQVGSCVIVMESSRMIAPPNPESGLFNKTNRSHCPVGSALGAYTEALFSHFTEEHTEAKYNL